MDNKDKILSKEEYKQLDFNKKIILIEEISKKIIEDVNKNINEINILFYCINDFNNKKVSLLGILSLCEIFKEITPLYKIDLKSNHKKLTEIIKKDERKLINTEINIVNYFEKYIHMCISLICNIKSKITDNDIIKEYNIVIIKAFSELVYNLSHFNHIELCYEFLFKKIFNLNNNIKPLIIDFISNIIKDKTPSILEIKYKLFTYISKKIKINKFLVKLPRCIYKLLIDIEINIDLDLLSETIKKTDSKDTDEHNIINMSILKKLNLGNETDFKINIDKELIKLRDLKKRNKITKSQLKILQKKEIEHKNKIKNINSKDNVSLKKIVKKELQESSAEYDKKYLYKINIEILNKYFYIIFKILSQGYNSQNFDISIQGIMKYSQLINYKFLNDIYQQLKSAIDNIIEQLKGYKIDVKNVISKKFVSNNYKKLLSIIFALKEIRNKARYILEIDDNFSYKNLYKILFNMLNNSLCFSIIKKNEKAMIFKFLEYYLFDKVCHDKNIIISYFKICIDIAYININYDIDFAYGLVLFAKILQQKYSYINQIIVKNESDFIANGVYYKDSDNPYIKNTYCYNMYNDLINFHNRAKLISGKNKEKIIYFLDKIITSQNIDLKYISKRVSDLFISITNI